MNVRTANILWIAGRMSRPPKNRAPGRKSLAIDASTPGGRLYSLRKRGRMTQDDLAGFLGVSRTQISKYERDEGKGIPDYVVKRAALKFGVHPSWIRYGDAEGRMARVVGKVGAGGHVDAIAYDAGREIEIPESWSDATALEIDGTSCWPIYEDGDIIIVRGERRLIEHEVIGRMCVIETEDGRGLVKRLQRGREAGLYKLESPNAPLIEGVRVISARPVRMHLSI